MKKLLTLILFVTAFSGSLSAQDHVSFTYPISIGTGDLGDYISQPSFRGIAIDYRRDVKTNLAIGFHLAWNVFYEEMSKETYTVDNASLTGKQYRYQNSFPMLATATYFLKPEETLNPFVTLGIGTVYNRRNTDMNIYTLEQEAWNFALQPEAGFLYEIAENTAISISVKYYSGFKGGNELTEAQNYVSLNLGFSFF
jgi:opacity protein-like surface antigen